ncbi:CAP domain-containing protein [Corynebacterium sp. 32222D000AT]
MPRFNFNIQQIISAVLSLLTILGIIIGGISSGSSIPAAPPAATSSASQQAVLDATNDFRAQNGLAPVKANAALNDLAQDWAETIARTGEFKHRANYWEHYPANMRPGGENIAQGNRGDSGRVFVNRWANSPRGTARTCWIRKLSPSAWA